MYSSPKHVIITVEWLVMLWRKITAVVKLSQQTLICWQEESARLRLLSIDMLSHSRIDRAHDTSIRLQQSSEERQAHAQENVVGFLLPPTLQTSKVVFHLDERTLITSEAASVHHHFYCAPSRRPSQYLSKLPVIKITKDGNLRFALGKWVQDNCRRV